MLTAGSVVGKLGIINRLPDEKGATAMLAKEVTYDKPDIQQVIERLRDDLAGKLNVL